VTARRIGPYELEWLLGEGGIGQVYAARDMFLGRKVAIKMLRPEYAHDAQIIDRFFIEAKSLGNLEHPNITMIHALHQEGGDAYMVMELVNGRTLDAMLDHVHSLDLQATLAVLGQAVAGLGYAHRAGVIHRDVKPSNLMVTAGGLLKIMDFGIARMQGGQHLTRTGDFQGTLVFASPEQIRGDAVDERTDQYSLAVVAYKLLTGSSPFVADSDYALMTAHLQHPPPPLGERALDVDAETEAALMKALAKQPDQRFASIEEFGEAIGAMRLRGEAQAILHERYAAAFADDADNATRIAPRRRTGSREGGSSGSRGSAQGSRPSPASRSGAIRAQVFELESHESQAGSRSVPAARLPPTARRRSWRMIIAGAATTAVIVAAIIASYILGVRTANQPPVAEAPTATQPEPPQPTPPPARPEPTPSTAAKPVPEPPAAAMAPASPPPEPPAATKPTAEPTATPKPAEPPASAPVSPAPAPASTPAPAPPPTPTFAEALSARLAAVSPGLDDKARAEMVSNYTEKKDHKAVALLPGAADWQVSDRDSTALASTAALEACQVHFGRPCVLIATDSALEPEPSDGKWAPRDMPRVEYAGEFDPAEIPNIVPPARARADVAGYRSVAGPKAAAFSPYGSAGIFIATGAADQNAAEADALRMCLVDKGDCFLYAAGNQVVLPKRLKQPLTPPPAPVAAVTPPAAVPPVAATPPAAPALPDEAQWSADDRRAVQKALVTLGLYDGLTDGDFGPGTHAAIVQYRSFAGDTNTGPMTGAERQKLVDLAAKLSGLLDRPARSPDGVAAAAVGRSARYARGWDAETGTGVKADPKEAAYWYALAGADGDARALTNLGTLYIRGQASGGADPEAARALWWAAAVKGEAIAMFDLGVLAEHRGGNADLAEARAWYTRAAAKNHAGAQAALKRLGPAEATR
jgi:eukaryotic-like serine/threonine-protein kinase